MASRNYLTVPVLLSLALGLLQAQENPEPKLVNLNVIAVDSRGQPVEGLTADDFQVTDSGKPQKVVFFRRNDTRLWQVPPLSANQFSNRHGAKFPHGTVILFDLLNQSFNTRGVARNELVKYLQSVEDADYLYLYILTIDGRLFPVRGLPEDTDDLAEPGGVPWTRQIKPIMDKVMEAVTRTRPVDIDIAARVQLTYAALNTLGFQLQRIPGRKNIAWITDGVPIQLGPRYSDTNEVVDFTPLLRQMSESFERAGVSIYPVRQIMLGSPDDVGGTTAGQSIDSLTTLDDFAGATGGRPNTGKDIPGVVRQAMADINSSYHIAYYPAPPTWDGKFHKIRVTTSRKGVRLQTRTGYYGWSFPAGEETHQAIDGLASTNFDAAEIGLVARMSRDPAKPSQVHFDVRIDAGDVALAREGGRYAGQLRVAVVGYFESGRTPTPAIVPLDVNYTAVERDRALKDGISFHQNIELDGKTKSVRFIVYDRGSRQSGSVTIPLDK